MHPHPPIELSSHILPSVLRTILRSIVEDRQSVPANYYITANYDYQDDSLVLEVVQKIGLDVVAQSIYS